MNRCASSWHHNIAERRIFIYQVHGEQRLTLSIISKGSLWALDQLRGTRNTIPSEHDLDIVHTWLNQQ